MTENRGIRIRSFEGFEIYYRYKKFRAINDELELEANTEEALEELIKKQLLSQRRFKPIDVIRTFDGKRGRLTSKVADKEGYVYFSTTDSRGEKSHSQEKLEPHDWQERKLRANFVEESAQNLYILKRMEEEQEKAKRISEGIEKLRDSLEKPVTEQSIRAAKRARARANTSLLKQIL